FEACLLGGAAHALARHLAIDPVPVVTDGEDEVDLGGRRPLVDDRADEPFVVVAGDAAVEGEGDAVDDRRLARTGRPHEGEHVDVGEVDLGALPERAEALEHQADGPHVSLSPPWTAASSSE